MNQCKTCNAYVPNEVGGTCQARPPVVLAHLLARGFDDGELLGATVYPVVLEDDTACREYVLANELRGI